MPIGISTLSDFLLTKEAREGLVAFRLILDPGMSQGKAKRIAATLASALGPAWSGYAYTRASGLTDIVVESAEYRAL